MRITIADTPKPRQQVVGDLPVGAVYSHDIDGKELYMKLSKQYEGAQFCNCVELHFGTAQHTNMSCEVYVWDIEATATIRP